ncbi:MAG: hypothetical protein K1X72_21750 [Pyrinomonadaceae bacterium]|nr:hypothetical protein [Pyrinomonadaceae bacterium]
MLKQLISLVLVGLIINLTFYTSANANDLNPKEAKFAQKVKAEVEKLGIGKESQVKVKLKDGVEIKGYISQINEDSFVVVDEKTGNQTEVSYPQATQIKGNNLSTGTKIAIGVGIVLGIFVLFGILQSSN